MLPILNTQPLCRLNWLLNLGLRRVADLFFCMFSESGVEHQIVEPVLHGIEPFVQVVLVFFGFDGHGPERLREAERQSLQRRVPLIKLLHERFLAILKGKSTRNLQFASIPDIKRLTFIILCQSNL